MRFLTREFAFLTTKTAVLIILGIPWTSADGSVFTWEAAPQNTNWDNALNWSGPANQVPDDNTDTATVSGLSVIDPQLTSNRTIGALSILSGGVIFTGNGTDNYSLIVQNNGGQTGATIVDEQGTGNFTALYVEQSPSALDFDTDSLQVLNSGRLFIRNNARVQVDQVFRTAAGGSIVGNGLLEFGDDSINDGILHAVSGMLTIRRVGTAELDLDGAVGDGQLYASPNATLVIDTPLSDSLFNGTVQLLSNTELRINADWELASSANTQLDFSAITGSATLSGTGVTLSGVVNVNSGTAVLAAPTLVTNTATVTVSQGSTLQFDAATTFDDPESIVNEFDTTLVVNDMVSVGQGVGNFNWDGLGQNGVVQGTTIVNPGGFLSIQVQSLDEPGLDERVSANIILNGGSIGINTADDQWEMAGTLSMQASGGDNPALYRFSNYNDEVLITGDVVVQENGGTCGIRMNSIFGGTSHVDVRGGGNLIIGGFVAGVDTVINGGTWTGGGIVSLDADTARVASATAVDMPNGTFDIDGEFGGHTVVLDAPLTLNVNSVERIPGEVVDDPLQINGSGRLDVRFTNPNLSYTIAGPLDLNALGGGFASQQLAGARVRLAGTTDVSGNSIATAPVDIAGVMNIAAGGQFQIRGGTEANPSVVRAGAAVVGPGDLVISASGPGYLRLDDAAGVGAELFNHGHMEVGSSPGHAAVNWYFQSATGVYEVEIDGLTPSAQYDQLLVANVANIDGTLEVLINDNGGSYIDPTTPGTFDQFSLILAADLNGTYDTFLYEGVSLASSFTVVGQDRFHVGSGLFRILDYDPAELDLLNYRALPGDANGDGSVDGSDFNIWNANKFTVSNDWTHGDFNSDGVVDGGDFNVWNSNKFTGIDLGRPATGPSDGLSPSVVPEPTSAFMTIGGLVACLLGRRNRKTG